MKKMLSLLLAVCLLATMLVLPAGAATTQEYNAADALNSLGLFLGTTRGYELDSSLTRNQSAMLLVRMLGELTEAETGKYTHPFDDVARWASNVVAYAYTNNLVKGYNATKYGGEDTVTDVQYLTIVLRVLGYTDSGASPDFKYRESRRLGKTLGLVDSEQSDANFTRGDAVDIFWRALNTNLKNENRTLAQRLIEQKVFDEAAFATAVEYAKNGNPGSTEERKPDTGSDSGKTDDGKKNDSGEKKLEDTTWEEYQAMTAAEQYAFFQKFKTPEAFFAWQEKAKAKYDKNQKVIEAGEDGTIDLGDLVGKP